MATKKSSKFRSRANDTDTTLVNAVLQECDIFRNKLEDATSRLQTQSNYSTESFKERMNAINCKVDSKKGELENVERSLDEQLKRISEGKQEIDRMEKDIGEKEYELNRLPVLLNQKKEILQKQEKIYAKKLESLNFLEQSLTASQKKLEFSINSFRELAGISLSFVPHPSGVSSNSPESLCLRIAFTMLNLQDLDMEFAFLLRVIKSDEEGSSDAFKVIEWSPIGNADSIAVQALNRKKITKLNVIIVLMRNLFLKSLGEHANV